MSETAWVRVCHNTTSCPGKTGPAFGNAFRQFSLVIELFAYTSHKPVWLFFCRIKFEKLSCIII